MCELSYNGAIMVRRPAAKFELVPRDRLAQSTSGAPAYGLIARIVTSIASAIQKTSANLVVLGAMSFF
jgi:hypothetical protein